MKKYLIIALLLLSATAYGFGGLMMGSGTVVSGGGASYPASPLLDEDFEGAGLPSGWSASGTIDWDEATIYSQGSESAELIYVGSIAAEYLDGLTSSGEFWGFFRMYVPTWVDSQYFFNLGPNLFTGYMSFRTNLPNWRITCQGVNFNDTGGSLSNATWYGVWWHYKAETADTNLDGVCEIWWDTIANACDGTTCTRPAGSGDTYMSVTTGATEATDIDSFRFRAVNQDFYVDNVVFDDEEITDIEDD